MKKIIIFGCIGLVAGFAVANDSPDWAGDYAALANAYQQKNIELSCGYREERWHSDVEGHTKFAKAIGETTALNENNVRKIAIEQCESAWRYAEQGVAQNEENIKRGCGISGAMWHSDISKHFNWAMKQTPYLVAIHDQQRRFKLSLCDS